MKILITGGAGFIGSHTAEAMVSEGNRVCIIDELNDFYDPAMKLDNLAAVKRVGPVQFEQCDIADEHAVDRVFDAFQPEAVIHLAARAGVRPSVENPLLYERANVRGTLVLLEACRRARIRKLIFASSSSIYGIANRVPFSEDDHLNEPISPYAATKIAGEKLCFTYSHLHSLPIVCLRFFTVYGPRQRPDLAIRKFIELIEAGKPVPVYGDGSSARDYTYTDDIVAGIKCALSFDCSYDVFNLGNSHPISLLEMVRTIEAAVGKEALLDWKPAQPGDVPITFADLTKSTAVLGYAPRVPFAQGIRKFVEWHRGCRSTEQVKRNG